MANIKDIAATLAILGSGVLVMSGCGKDKPATEVPAGGDAAGGEAEKSCGGEGEKACGGEGEAAADGGEAAGEGEAAADGGGEAAPEGSCGGK
jgi:hypothetical protein